MSGTVLTRSAVPCRARAEKAGWLAWLATAMRTIETRRRLAQMDDRMLKDIGVTPSEAWEEANRAPWDLGPKADPGHWVRR